LDRHNQSRTNHPSDKSTLSSLFSLYPKSKSQPFFALAMSNIAGIHTDTCSFRIIPQYAAYAKKILTCSPKLDKTQIFRPNICRHANRSNKNRVIMSLLTISRNPSKNNANITINSLNPSEITSHPTWVHHFPTETRIPQANPEQPANRLHREPISLRTPVWDTPKTLPKPQSNHITLSLV